MAKKNAAPGWWSALSALHPRAPATVLLAIACIGVWMVIQETGIPVTQAQWSKRGVYSVEEIRSGKWWGLWSACLVHVALWHLVFNVYLLWILGSRIEVELGTWKYVGLTLVAGALSSMAQIVAEGTPGHGYSGIGYALFGFAWVASPRYPTFRAVLTPGMVVVFLVWLVACIAMTQTGVMAIGNGAHVGGLICGASLAYGFVRGKLVGKAAFTAFLLFLAVGWWWRPWSPTWSFERAWAAHQRGDIDAAARGYRNAMWWGGDETVLRERLAYAYMAGQRQDDLDELLAEIEAEDRDLARTIRTNQKVYQDLRVEAANAPAEHADYYRGVLALWEWRFADARRHLESALATWPEDPNALIAFVRAVSLDDQAEPGTLTLGLQRAERAVELGGRNDPELLDKCASLASRLGDHESAGSWGDQIVGLASRRNDVPRELLERAEEYRAERDRFR